MKLFTLTLKTMLIFSVFASSSFAVYKSTFEKCLESQPNETQLCLSKINKKTTLNSCFEAADSLKSNYLKENTRLYCFYQISHFSNLDKCINQAQKFILADNHDAALFECHNQFQLIINKKSCLKISNLFRFDSKGRYLKNYCDSMD